MILNPSRIEFELTELSLRFLVATADGIEHEYGHPQLAARPVVHFSQDCGR